MTELETMTAGLKVLEVVGFALELLVGLVSFYVFYRIARGR